MDELTRGEWLIASVLITAIRCANTVDSADAKPGGEMELPLDAKLRISKAVVEQTSRARRASRVQLCQLMS